MNPPSRNQRPDSSRQSSRTSGQKTRPNSGNVKNHPLSAPERLPLTAETEAVHALQPHTNDVSAANPVITDKGRKNLSYDSRRCTSAFSSCYFFCNPKLRRQKAESASSQNTQTEGKIILPKSE